MTMQRMNQLQSLVDQSGAIATDAAQRFDGCHNQWVAVIKLMEEKGLSTETEYREIYKKYVIDPELERQKTIMTSHNTRHEDGSGCPIRCKLRQEPPDTQNFDPNRCQYLWESCPAGFNPNASDIVRPNLPGKQEIEEQEATYATEASVDDVLAEAAQHAQEEERGIITSC